MAGLVAFSFSLWFSHQHFYKISGYSTRHPVEAGPDEIAKAIKGNADARDQFQHDYNIAGESDGSLNNQLRLMRQDLNDFAKTVPKRHHSFHRCTQAAITTSTEPHRPIYRILKAK